MHQRLGGLAVAAHEERTGMGELALGRKRRPLREIGERAAGVEPLLEGGGFGACRRNVTMLGQVGLAEMNAT